VLPVGTVGGGATILEYVNAGLIDEFHDRACTRAVRYTILTTQEGADLLGISRPTLVRLLEAGEIPFTKPGRHRRIALADLIAYQNRARNSRRETLDAMTSEAAEDGAYERVNGFAPTR